MPTQDILKLINNFLEFQEFIKSASPHTIKSYSFDLRQCFKSCKFYTNESELISHIRKSQLELSELQASSRNRKAATLKSFLKWLFEKNYLSKDISTQIACPKVPKKIPHFISIDEAIGILKSYTEDEIEDKILFLLLYGGGLRISEACNLEWKNINCSSGIIKVLGKGKKERLVKLPLLVISELRKLKPAGNYIWGHQPINSRTAYNIIHKRGKKAGLIKPLHPHALRHSYATHLLSSGADLRTLQELLGHTSLMATEKYTHLGMDQLARTMEKHHPLGSKGRI